MMFLHIYQIRACSLCGMYMDYVPAFSRCSSVTYYYLLTIGIVLSQKDSDEGRPYEFGFTIDGQQHRHEKKDQNGIVQGEFGFITADGVYHVTVYATDENGNFKILSMRNIRISAPLDGSPATGPISPEAGKYLKKGNQIEATVASSQLPQRPLSPQSPQQKTEIFQQHTQKSLDSSQALEITTRKPQLLVFTTRPTIKPACGGCGYVTTETSSPKQKFQFQNSAFQFPVTGGNQHLPPTGVPISQEVNREYTQSPDNVLKKFQPEVQMLLPSIEPRINSVNINTEINNIQNTEHKNLQQTSQYKENLPYQQKIPYSQNIASENERFIPSSINKQNEEKYPISENEQKLYAKKNQNVVFSPTLEDHNQSVNGFSQQQLQQHNYQRESMSNVPGIKSIGTNLLPGGAIGPNPLLTSEDKISKIPPISVSDNIIHVGGNKPIDIPIKDKYPGMVNGLPEGIEENDIKGILYKFHYTVGFHGHYEKGLSNGAKIGGYFVNGRDGISRVVTYVADENGYRPKFKFINLGLDSPDTPKEDTEKSFGLKNFEFIWYPVQ